MMTGSVEAPDKTRHRTFHLADERQWLHRRNRDFYTPEAFDKDGFIHCTNDADELIRVANRYYHEAGGRFVALEIECSMLSLPVIYEDPGRIYPHIVGPLNVSAVRRVFKVERLPNGQFLVLGSEVNCRTPPDR
jgi:uncharacterized protein (DUF952 family)